MSTVPIRPALALGTTRRGTGLSILTVMLAPSWAIQVTAGRRSARATERSDLDIAHHEIRRKPDDADEDASKECRPEVVHAVRSAEGAGEHQHQRVDHEEEEAEGDDRQR